MHRRTLLTTATLATLATPTIPRAQPTRTLKFVPYTDLAVLDPIVTGNYAVRNHALMVFDTLYGVDDSNTPQPQMLEGHRIDDNGLTWTLTLRDYLKFHDNTPVLARDVLASIRRWATKDVLGIALAAVTNEMTAPDDRTVRIRLKTPFPLLPYAFGKSVGTILPIMPERLALTDSAKPVAEIIGSGPFRYLAGERIQGDRNVYERFAGYVPRPTGTPSGLAGPKIVHFDRVEWRTIPDAATSASALQKGEIDWWQQPTTDYWADLKRRPGIKLDIIDPAGSYNYIRINCLNPPFDNPAIRRAALAAIDQADITAAIAGTDPAMSHTPVGFFAPDSPMASQAGMENLRSPPDLARARLLLKDAGYKGEKIVVVTFPTIATLNASALVAADAFRRIGFNVEIVALEIAAALQRLAVQAPVEANGWSIATESFAATIARDPVLISNMRAIGRAGTFGWPDIPRLAALRETYLTAATPADQQAICRDIQELCFREVPYIPAGITYQPTAYGRDLTGMLRGLPLFYNLRRT
jgi:peptide/nickel transport system substrate-binding protein